MGSGLGWGAGLDGERAWMKSESHASPTRERGIPRCVTFFAGCCVSLNESCCQRDRGGLDAENVVPK
jgi:hypothetical protein